MKISRKQLIISISALLILVCIASLVVFIAPLLGKSGQADETTTIETRGSNSTLTPSPTPTPQPAGTPRLDRLEMVTDQAFGDGNNYVPNGWGVHKTRIVRTSTGDIFTVYISEGSHDNRTWHLMHRPPNGNWEEIKNGNAGAEPINIVLGPHDEIHLFTWPGTNAILDHLESIDLGKTWTSQTLPGKWIVDQGYGGAAINSQGDIIVFQTGADKPGAFLWSYYTPETNQWKFNSVQIDYRCTYAFFFPGNNNDLTITCMRDLLRDEIGYPPASGDFQYVFDESEYFYIKDINNPQPTQLIVKKVPPQSGQDYNLTYSSDAYMDTQGRTHILYNNLYSGPHHVIIQNGQVIKDVAIHQINQKYGNKMRITQDAAGRFYILWIDDNGSLYVLPGAADDTDGTNMEPVVKLNISKYPGCIDDDFCQLPTFTIPRSGNPRSNYIDGTYGNFNKVIYFRINLRGTNEGKS